MAILGPGGFDATKHNPTSDFEPLPAGKYLAAITASAMKPTKARDGEYLELKCQVLEGDHKGRVLYARLNLKNRNRQAVEIAQSELAAICRAVGVLQPKDSEELHLIPLVIDVRLKKRRDTGETTNEIRRFYPRGGGGAAEAVTADPHADEHPPWGA